METIKRFSVDAVTSIQIKSMLSQVNVVGGRDSDIVLRWTDTKRRTTLAELNEKMLTVKDHADVALYGILGLIWLKEDKELTLELPTEFKGIVQLESKAECIRVLGVTGSCSIQAKTTVAAIDVSATSVQEYDFTSQNGSILLHGITSQKGISATTDGGNIECFCGEPTNSYMLDCHSEHGLCSLPKSVSRGRKYLRLRSKTGAITVNFTE